MTLIKTGAALLVLLILAGCSRTGFREAAYGLQNRARGYAAAQELQANPSQTTFDGPSGSQPAAAQGAKEDAAAATAAAAETDAASSKPAPQQPYIYYYESPPPPAPAQ